MVIHIGMSKALVVTAFQRTDGLKLVGEHHASQTEQRLQFIVSVLHPSYASLLLSEGFELRLVRQFYVHRHLITWQVFFDFARVVVSYDFHVRHIVGRNISGCEVIFSSQEVESLDIEL